MIYLIIAAIVIGFSLALTKSYFESKKTKKISDSFKIVNDKIDLATNILKEKEKKTIQHYSFNAAYLSESRKLNQLTSQLEYSCLPGSDMYFFISPSRRVTNITENYSEMKKESPILY